jgi:deazaflavin-dependent oxidoreductase (nitroreductase family)
MPGRFSNFFVKTIVNSPFHFVLGDSFAVITLTGRKTGKEITTPINTVNIDDRLTVISMRNRNWWRNLLDGRSARLRQSGKQFTVQGKIIEDPVEIAFGLKRYFMQYPNYAKYFQIHPGPDGKPDPTDIERVANERVLIQLIPVKSQFSG